MNDTLILSIVAICLFALLYLLAHPNPTELKAVYRLRHTLFGEYLAQTAHRLFNPQLLQCGSTRDEAECQLPGDELILKPVFDETRAITIHTPPEAIWPWLAQMGEGRAGWYFWVLLAVYPPYASETSPHLILPEHQRIAVGDRLYDGWPACTPERGGWEVKQVEQNRALVLFAARRVNRSPDFDPNREIPREMHCVCSWSFVLRPVHTSETRLLVRTRAMGGPWYTIFLMRVIFGFGDRAVQRFMLLGLKERAEKDRLSHIAASFVF